MRTAKTLLSLGEFPGWSESLLDAQPFCWFCHVAAHLLISDERRQKLCEAAKEIARENKGKSKEPKFSIDQLLDKVCFVVSDLL